MRHFWATTIAWLVAGIQALSTDRYGGALYPTKFVQVHNIHIQPNETWQGWNVGITTLSNEFKLAVKKKWQFEDEEVLSWATRGEVSILEGNTWKQGGWSRIVINHHGSSYTAQGSFEISGETWHLSNHPDVGYILWKESDLETNHIDSITEENHPQGVLHRRSSGDNDSSASSQDLLKSIGNKTGCPQSPHTARIGVAADMNFLSAFNTTLDAKTHIVDTVNKASQVWEQAFGITLVLGELLIANQSYVAKWNKVCGSSDSSVDTLQYRLNVMSSWRSNHTPAHIDGLAQWTLFTHCPSGNLVGLAWQGMACKSAGVNVVDHSVLDYRVLAHETGHIFGAVHDCTENSCAQGSGEITSDTGGPNSSCCPFSKNECDAGGQYIMNPASSLEQFIFSPCTQGNVCGAIGRGAIDSSCLIPDLTNTTTTNSSICTSDLSPRDYLHCRRDLQCIELTGQQDSYACNDSTTCTMNCYDASTHTCIAHTEPFEDGTPCGMMRSAVCVSARCNAKMRPSNGGPPRRGSSHGGPDPWFWIVVILVPILAVMIVAGACLLFCTRKRKLKESSSIRKEPDYSSDEKIPT